MQPPVVVADGLDVSAYDSPLEASRAVEGIDVERGMYSLWDSQGLRLRFILTQALTKGSMGEVAVEVAEDAPSGAQELRDLLIKYFGAAGFELGSLDRAPLDMLVSEVVRRTKAV